MTSVQTWTPELVDEAVSLYIERIEAFDEEERPERTIEVTQGVADELGFKLNSTRARLSKATRADGTPVYVRKVKAKPAKSATAEGTKTPSKRISKADAQEALKGAMHKIGATVSPELDELIVKMTGKLAQALADSLTDAGE